MCLCRAGVQCTDKCKCEECKNKSDADSTPRERDALRPIASSSRCLSAPLSRFLASRGLHPIAEQRDDQNETETERAFAVFCSGRLAPS